MGIRYLLRSVQPIKWMANTNVVHNMGPVVVKQYPECIYPMQSYAFLHVYQTFRKLFYVIIRFEKRMKAYDLQL